MGNKRKGPVLMLILTMVIFGTVGIVRKDLGISSAVLASARGGIGAVCILIFMFLSRVTM